MGWGRGPVSCQQDAGGSTRRLWASDGTPSTPRFSYLLQEGGSTFQNCRRAHPRAPLGEVTLSRLTCRRQAIGSRERTHPGEGQQLGKRQGPQKEAGREGFVQGRGRHFARASPRLSRVPTAGRGLATQVGQPGAQVPHRTTLPPKGQESLPGHSWAGAVPRLARETVGTQGGVSAPSWAPTKAAVPQPGQVPLCQVRHRAGWGPPCPSRLMAAYHSLVWIIHHFGVIAQAFTSWLTSPGHPNSPASPSCTASSGNVNQFKY